MFRRKAFLHWYTGEGMDEMEFTEAESNMVEEKKTIFKSIKSLAERFGVRVPAIPGCDGGRRGRV
jgi:hypothetical protein